MFWLEPGYIWLFLFGLVTYVIYMKYFYNPDQTKEYVKNEMNISGGTVTKSAKFAYSNSNPTKNVRKLKFEKNISPVEIHNYRKKLVKDLTEVDEISAFGYAII
jgi:hypothetical protein